MQPKKLDLIEMSRIIYKKKWFILIFALCAVAVGLVFSLVTKNQYTSTSVFIVKSPMNMDRNHIFRQGHYERNDFFANADDIDNIMTISQNEVLLQFLIDSLKLTEHYNAPNAQKAYKTLKQKFKVKRNDNLSIEFKATDFDPQMAAKITNTARWETGVLFRNYFLQSNNQYIEGLQSDIDNLDKEITQMDDSIQNIRQQYQISSALLPVRGNSIQTAPQNIDATKAVGLELLAKTTSIKDQLLKDRATFVSLINEYRMTTPGDGMDMFYTIQYAWPSDEPSFPKIPLVLAICFAAGLFFAIILVLLQAGVKYINEEENN